MTQNLDFGKAGVRRGRSWLATAQPQRLRPGRPATWPRGCRRRGRSVDTTIARAEADDANTITVTTRGAVMATLSWRRHASEAGSPGAAPSGRCLYSQNVALTPGRLYGQGGQRSP